MSKNLSPKALCWPATVCAVLVLALPTPAQIQVKSEDITMRFGIQGQLWADWTQTSGPTAQGYQQNLYLRRARILLGGDIGKDVSFFIQTDSPNLGKTPKTGTSSFILQDAFLEWKASNAFRVDGGMYLVPFSRNTMQSTVNYYTLDLSALTTVSNSATQSTALRDFGFGARGFFLKDKMQYRLGVFQGQRDANARNSLRTSGYVQYDFFEPETGYTFVGTALGKKKILAVDAGFDAQGTYAAQSANVALDLPVFQGDEIGGQFQYFHYDGGDKFTAVHNQNDWFVEGAYYVHRLKLQPFGKFEGQQFVEATDSLNDIRRAGGGVNCYIHGQNLKWTFQFVRALPQSGSSLKPSNELTMQLQVFYF